MHRFEVYLATLCSATIALAIGHPQVTPYPANKVLTSFREHQLDLRREKRTHVRDYVDDLAFCYGENAICVSSVNLFNACNDFENQKDQNPWYQCICGNGYVSVAEACGWCEIAYNTSTPESVNSLNEINSEECSSHSLTIAPIPSTILALESSYNATYTGTLPTSGSVVTSTQGNSRTDSAITSSPTSSQTGSTTTKSSKKSSSVSTSTITFGGGGGGSFTPVPTVTVTQAPTGAVGTGAGEIRRVNIGILLTAVALGAVAII